VVRAGSAYLEASTILMRGDAAFGEQRLPPEDHDDEANAIAGGGDERNAAGGRGLESCLQHGLPEKRRV
jgi:hypothetical protein